PVIGRFEPWRFLTAAFLHSPGWYVHIIFNMVALWMVGPYLETTLGRLRYTVLYLLSAVGGSVAVVAVASLAHSQQQWFTGVVGASGAVFGLFGAVLVVVRRLGGNARGILGVIAVNVVLSFVVSGISW